MQLLPKNSIFIKCIQAYQRYRLMIGLNCMSERRLQQEASQAYDQTNGKKAEAQASLFT